MRKVSKANAAALSGEAEVRSSKRKPAKKTLVESDADDESEPEKDQKVEELKPKDSNGKPAKDDDISEEEEETYEVESILGSRFKHGKQQFKIRWKGFGPADDTWEDEENVDSPDLIASFLKNSSPQEKTEKKASGINKAKKRSAPPTPKEKLKKPKIDPNADESTEWEVSKIIDDVELKDGRRQFLVRWKGYSSKDDTWEPEENLNCTGLIQKYLALMKQKEEVTRETREVRKQVYKYNPELTKRSSHRALAKRSGAVGSGITSYSYQALGDSSYSDSHNFSQQSWNSNHFSDNRWFNKMKRCVIM